MNKLAYRIITLATLCLASASGVQAQEMGSSTPALPAAPQNTVGNFFQSMNPMNWKMPKVPMPKFSNMLPSKQEKERVIKKKDGLVAETTQTAKNTWNRTKNALNPMQFMPAGFKSNQTKQPAPSTKKKEGGFFNGLFSPFPPEDKAAKPTVNEFLKQPRIQ